MSTLDRDEHPARPLTGRSPDDLFEALRESILTCRRAPGERLIQEELAAEFGTSRIPLREALRRLEGEGLVVIAPHRGAIVRPFVPKDVVDLYEVRLALETLAVRRAAARFTDLEPVLNRYLSRSKRAAAANDSSALFHIDRDFHADLAAAADNPHLSFVLASLWSQVMRAMHAFFSHADYGEDTWSDHTAIAAAVKRGDGDGAVSVLKRHINDSRDNILTFLRSH